MCPCRRASAGTRMGGKAAQEPPRHDQPAVPATRRQGSGFAHIRPKLVPGRAPNSGCDTTNKLAHDRDAMCPTRTSTARQTPRLPEGLGQLAAGWQTDDVQCGYLMTREERRKQVFDCLACRIFAWPLLSPLSVLLHELGHLVAARICGCPANTITLGYGSLRHQFSIFGITIGLRKDRWGCHGKTYTHAYRVKGARKLFIIGSGPFVHSAFGAIIVLLSIDRPHPFTWTSLASPVSWYGTMVGTIWWAEGVCNMCRTSLKSDGRHFYLTLKYRGVRRARPTQ